MEASTSKLQMPGCGIRVVCSEMLVGFHHSPLHAGATNFFGMCTSGYLMQIGFETCLGVGKVRPLCQQPLRRNSKFGLPCLFSRQQSTKVPNLKFLVAQSPYVNCQAIFLFLEIKTTMCQKQQQKYY